MFEFELHADGSISRVRLIPGEERPRLEKLCEQAIVESAPFPKWTPEMIREIGADVRSIRVGFDLGSSAKAP